MTKIQRSTDIGTMLITLHKRYRKFKPQVVVTGDQGSIKIPAGATNNADCLLFDPKGSNMFYQTNGVQRAFVNFIASNKWQVGYIQGGELFLTRIKTVL